MKRFISIFCACAISIMGSLSCDLKIDLNKKSNRDNISVSVDDNAENLGTEDSYYEEYDVVTGNTLEETKESNEGETVSGKIRINSYIPSSYKNRKNTTLAKNQKDYSTCWAFSAISAIESNLMKKGLVNSSVNLSEAGLVYFTYNKVGNSTKDTVKNISGKNYLRMGGNKTITMYALASGVCLSNESIMPYSKITEKTKYSNAYAYSSNYMVRDIGIINANKRNDIKNTIYKYGAVSASLYQVDSGYNTKTYAYNQKITTKVNHTVSIVGWDDNYSRNNFRIKPSKNGAWLVKNSWGTTWGDKGFFWVSYEDKALNYKDNTVYYYNMEKKNSDYLNLYEYDGTYSNTTLANTRFHSNVYTCKQNEMISDVMFFTNENNVSYQISIYTDVKETPSEGQLAYTQKGEVTYAGCHTIKLSKGVNIKKDSKYSVVIRLANKDGGTTKISIDRSLSYDGWIQNTTVAKKGESFYKSDGGYWVDAGVMLDANCRIKVFTKKGHNVSIQKNATKNNYNIKVNNIGASSINVKYVTYNKNTDETKVINYSKDNKNFVWSPMIDGAYKVQTYIKDETTGLGYVYTNNIIVSNLVGYTPKIVTKKNNLGTVVTATTKSSKDTTGNVLYYYNVFNLKNKIVRTKKWCKSGTYNFYAPGTGKYLIRCYIKDETGMIIKKDKNVEF